MDKIVELHKFKDKKINDMVITTEEEVEKMINEQINEMPPDAFIDYESALSQFKDLNEKHDLVFDNIDVAISFSNFLLDLPENESILYYNILFCCSRKSLFYKLEPIYKPQVKSPVFIDYPIINTLILDKIKKDMKKDILESKRNGD